MQQARVAIATGALLSVRFRFWNSNTSSDRDSLKSQMIFNRVRFNSERKRIRRTKDWTQKIPNPDRPTWDAHCIAQTFLAAAGGFPRGKHVRSNGVESSFAKFVRP